MKAEGEHHKDEDEHKCLVDRALESTLRYECRHRIERCSWRPSSSLNGARAREANGRPRVWLLKISF